MRFKVNLEVRDRRTIAGEQHRVLYAAPGGDQSRGGQISGVDEECRREIDKARTLIGPVFEYVRQPDACRTDVDRVAGMQAEPREQARIGPAISLPGNAAHSVSGSKWPLGNSEASTKWIALRYRTERGELVLIVGEHDAHQHRDARRRKSTGLRLGDHVLGDGIG